MHKLPNFLIVGMAKCGTSSLSKYLQQHPDVFISTPKEPRFITSQFSPFPLNGPKDDKVEAWYVKDLNSYQNLFESANTKAIGEASADTLFFHQGSIPVIKKHFGNPKIIIILRNPVKRAFSAYQHLVRDERESLSFEEALNLEPDRIKNNFELIYFYKAASLYYTAVKAFMEAFPEVKVVLSNDLSEKPQQVLSEVFSFLEVDDDFTVDTSLKHNISGLPKSRILHNILHEENFIRKLIRPLARTFLPTQQAREQMVNNLKAKNFNRLKINPQTKEDLTDFFADDVQKTQELIGRDLSKWLS